MVAKSHWLWLGRGESVLVTERANEFCPGALHDALQTLPEDVRVSALRKHGLMPAIDQKVDQLPKFQGAPANGLMISMVRLYRKLRPRQIGDRCVFEPSCSRYAELALRQHSVANAARLIFSRLGRCQPGHGGTDIVGIKPPEG